MKAKLRTVSSPVLGAPSQITLFCKYSKSVLAGNGANEVHVAERNSINFEFEPGKIDFSGFDILSHRFCLIFFFFFLWDKISLTDMRSLFTLRNSVPPCFPA